MTNLPWQNATQPQQQQAQPNQGGGLPFGQPQAQPEQQQTPFGQPQQPMQTSPFGQQSQPQTQAYPPTPQFGQQPAPQQVQPQFGQQQNQQMPDLAAKIAAAEESKRGVFPDPGSYQCLAVSQILSKFSRNGKPLFIAEFEIIASTVETRRAGSKVTWMANFEHDAAAGNVKSFLAALFDVTGDEVTPEASNWAMSAANPCQGRLIAMTASQIKTRNNTDFTVCDWTSIADEYQNQSEALRIEAGFPPNPLKTTQQ